MNLSLDLMLVSVIVSEPTTSQTFTNKRSFILLMFANDSHPHENAAVAVSGATFDESDQIILLIHGRGATAQSMFALGELIATEKTTLIAPQAVGNTWYPYSFLADETMNQPYLDSALKLLMGLIERLKKQGFHENQIVLMGFSQGACLSLELAARTGYSFKLIAGLSGGLIGETIQTANYKADLSSQKIFLGCSDTDFHIPVERVHQTEQIFAERGAKVVKKIYPNMGHLVNEDEINQIKKLLS